MASYDRVSGGRDGGGRLRRMHARRRRSGLGGGGGKLVMDELGWMDELG